MRRNNIYFSFIFSYIFASAIKNKHLVLLIDHGSSLKTDQLDLTKSFGKFKKKLTETNIIILHTLFSYRETCKIMEILLGRSKISFQCSLSKNKIK